MVQLDDTGSIMPEKIIEAGDGLIRDLSPGIGQDQPDPGLTLLAKAQTDDAVPADGQPATQDGSAGGSNGNVQFGVDGLIVREVNETERVSNAPERPFSVAIDRHMPGSKDPTRSKVIGGGGGGGGVGFGGGGTRRSPFSPRPLLWTKGKPGNSAQNLIEHFRKHRSDFPEIQNALQYRKRTLDFLNNPPPGTQTKIRQNGDILRYDPKTNTFGVMRSDGTPRTMFKPENGTIFWKKQK
jgi:hypothetical protein